MKKILLLTLISLWWPSLTNAQTSLAEKLSGKILLQVESYGRAWYVYPKTKERYYLKDGDTAYQIMRNLSLGITNKDLAKIPTTKKQPGDQALVNRLKGMILLQVEQNGEAWYVNPDDGVRYYLRDGQAAYDIMRRLSLGITNDNLRQITMNQSQLVHDTTFKETAYIKLDNNQQFSHQHNADVVLPLASLTKLMTALVLLDTNPDWQRIIEITPEHIQYPKNYVGDDATSEIPIKVKDRLTFYDLWVSMLVASSNQATAALVDNSGMSFVDFIKKMNDKATQLGLTKTIFYDVAGLDAHNVTTAKEMAIIAQAAFNQSAIKQAANITQYSAQVQNMSDSRSVNIANRNASLLNFSPEASKTGFLIEAQRTVALEKDNNIIVVMHALSMSQRNTIINNLLR